jgi:exonuclease III
MGKSVEELLEWERTETKYKMIQNVLPYIEKYAAIADSIPMIFAGDMNSLSHFDWAESTSELHNGLIVPWYSSVVLADLGLADSYRQMNPDPISNPGITWDSAGKTDEHRIDYIYYKGQKLRPTRSESFKTHLGEPMMINKEVITYPSDHGIVITNFEVEIKK